MVVILYLCIGSDTSIISFYAFYVYILCILPPWRLHMVGWTMSEVTVHII